MPLHVPNSQYLLFKDAFTTHTNHTQGRRKHFTECWVATGRASGESLGSTRRTSLKDVVRRRKLQPERRASLPRISLKDVDSIGEHSKVASFSILQLNQRLSGKHVGVVHVFQATAVNVFQRLSRKHAGGVHILQGSEQEGCTSLRETNATPIENRHAQKGLPRVAFGVVRDTPGLSTAVDSG